MEIFFAVNEGYIRQLCVAMLSVILNNRNSTLNFHILTSGLSDEAKIRIKKITDLYDNALVIYHTPAPELFDSLKLNIAYITKETYFRYLIADLTPELERALYLDADIIVNNSLTGLWEMDFGDNYCIGVKDLWIEHKNYKPEIGLTDKDSYVNAGVLLFNLEKIRKDGMVRKLFDNTRRLADKIAYQDQDIINLTFRGHIGEADSIFNYTGENIKYEPDKQAFATVIHYTGGKKPWHEKCKNQLKNLWQEYALKEERLQHKKIKVGLIIDEFFGGAGTAYGGYGFLARKFIAKYIPDTDIQIDVLLGKSKKKFTSQAFHEDDVDLYRLPRNRFMARHWLKKKNYDIYLSIELVDDFILRNEPNPHKKLILWVQDPRPKYEWDEISTVQLFPEHCYYNQRIYDNVHRWHKQGRVKFISQGYFLNQKAKDLYNLPANTDIRYMPNPVEIDNSFDIITAQKKNQIIFLGRIESVKRGWLFCEIAKKMPELEFFVLGQTFRDKEKNSEIMKPYCDISNLHFTGHVDGKIKERFLSEAKILVNTSIHEALPVSFLEALSYGTLLVSNRNPENLTSKFGIWVGDILGDGFDKIDLYVDAIRKIISNDKWRMKTARQAIDYVRERHNVSRFIHDLRQVIRQEIL